MTRDEVRSCLKTLWLAYPNSYGGLSKAETEDMISLWLKMFANDSFESVSNAIESLINKGQKFAPVIGEIKAEMNNGNPKSTGGELNRRPYPQSFIDTVHKFLAEEEAAGRYQRQGVTQ